MKKTIKILAIVVCLTFNAGAAFAQIQPEIMIKIRKAGYDFSAWNIAKIRGMVEYNPASFKKDQVVAAANAIAAIANSGMGELYGPGTDKNVGDQKTSVKPELFQEQDQVKKLTLANIEEANKLQQIASGGDINAIRVQLDKVADSCNACHARYKYKE
jgi:cytochrome c556